MLFRNARHLASMGEIQGTSVHFSSTQASELQIGDHQDDRARVTGNADITRLGKSCTMRNLTIRLGRRVTPIAKCKSEPPELCFVPSSVDVFHS